MFITQKTIEKVQHTAEIVDVVGKYVTLKKTGKNHQGCCPFHDEKTPSFYVTPSKNIYKCFGCGKGGDPIQFIIEKENLSFFDAIKHLAQFYNIEIEYEQKEENVEKVEESKQVLQLLKEASARYANNLFKNGLGEFDPAIDELLNKRLLTEETLIQFQLGFAPDNWKYLTPSIIDKGLYKVGIAAGLIKTTNGNTFDFFRNRIMIPIHDQNGNIVSFGGRKLPSDQDKENPKYLNGIENDVYKKDRILYGFHFAKKAIRDKGKALIVEGYFDVISFHQNEIENTVAPCGTALTLTQAKLLARQADHVIIVFDGDPAGQKSALRAVDTCLEAGLKVEIFLLPEGEDPDSFCRNKDKHIPIKMDEDSGDVETKTIEEHIYSNAVDGFTYKLTTLLKDKTDPDDIDEALDEICGVLKLINKPVKVDHYILYISKTYKIRESIITQKLKDLIKAEQGTETDSEYDHSKYIPKQAKEEPGNTPEKDLEEYGFFRMGNQYYRFNKSGNGVKPSSFSNFTMRVLFHLDNEKVPRRLIELVNFKGKKKTVDTPTTSLTSLSEFKKFTESQGNFQFNGNDADLSRIKNKLFDEEKDCRQLDILGWNPEGFWVFSNCLVNSQVIPLDENGIAEHNNINFYVPSGNKTYQLQPLKYANEKKFKHIQSEITFEKWAIAFHKVYKDPGMMGLCFTIACIFSDIIHQTMQGFPIMFLYGEGGSGKGSLIKSMQHLFGLPQDPLTLSGKANTDKAKIAVFAQYVNAVICLEEYRNNNEDIVNLLKGLWDRYGYTRRKFDTGVGTESVPISSGVIVTGNDYPQDDALLQRLLILEIHENARSQEALDNFNFLKELQEKGITSALLELLQLRKVFEETYNSNHKETFREVSAMLANIRVTDRMKHNITALVASFKIVARRLKFPFDYEQLMQYAKSSIIKQNDKRDTEGDVQRFWDLFPLFVREKKIIHGRDFRINGNEIMIRFGDIYDNYRRESAQSKLTYLNKTSLLEKLRNSEAYLASKDSAQFQDKRTSCHVFNYAKIGVDILYQIEYSNQDQQRRNGNYSDPTEPAKDVDPGF
jgi:DNA primase